jgi:hypothetical protein
MMHGELSALCSVSLFPTGLSSTFTEIDQGPNHQVDEGAYNQVDEGAFHQIVTASAYLERLSFDEIFTIHWKLGCLFTFLLDHVGTDDVFG